MRRWPCCTGRRSCAPSRSRPVGVEHVGLEGKACFKHLKEVVCGWSPSSFHPRRMEKLCRAELLAEKSLQAPVHPLPSSPTCQLLTRTLCPLTHRLQVQRGGQAPRARRRASALGLWMLAGSFPHTCHHYPSYPRQPRASQTETGELGPSFCPQNSVARPPASDIWLVSHSLLSKPHLNFVITPQSSK